MVLSGYRKKHIPALHRATGRAQAEPRPRSARWEPQRLVVDLGGPSARWNRPPSAGAKDTWTLWRPTLRAGGSGQEHRRNPSEPRYLLTQVNCWSQNRSYPARSDSVHTVRAKFCGERSGLQSGAGRVYVDNW